MRCPKAPGWLPAPCKDCIYFHIGGNSYVESSCSQSQSDRERTHKGVCPSTGPSAETGPAALREAVPGASFSTDGPGSRQDQLAIIQYDTWDHCNPRSDPLLAGAGKTFPRL
eukprot:113018-Chlamydomonas_euryale.AAC.1